jgi:hypothetical protein
MANFIHESRNEKLKHFHRKFSQSISLLPSQEADLHVPIGDLVAQGADVRVTALSGEITLNYKGKRHLQTIRAQIDENGNNKTFSSIDLADDISVDLSEAKVVLEVDYDPLFFPVKSEVYGRANDIKTKGTLSPEAMTNYKALSNMEKYYWLNERSLYLKELLGEHKAELYKLEQRYKASGRRLSDPRHMLLEKRCRTTQNNITQCNVWFNEVIMALELNGEISSVIKDLVLDID